jgi:DNA-binding NarL/FixJ family response regulator
MRAGCSFLSYRGPMGIRVMVVEDDSFTRLTVVGALRHSGIDVVADCDNPRDALADFRKKLPKVCLIDLDLGAGPTGIDVAAAMRRLDPAVGIVLLTSYQDPRLLSPGLRELPEGTRYVVKQALSDIDMLTVAIESAAEHPRSDAADAVGTDLTDTQIEILRLVAAGLSNAEIARIRVVDEKTVEQAISRTAKRLRIEGDSSINRRVALARAYYRLIGSSVARIADGDVNA